MKFICSILLLMLGTLAACAETETSYLLMWQVNDPVVRLVGGTEEHLSQIISETSSVDANDWGVRLSVTSASGESSYLNLWWKDGDGNWVWQDSEGYTIDGIGIDSKTAAGPTYADVSDYTSGAYVFALELGSWDANNNFTKFAGSYEQSYSDLLSNNHIQIGDLSTPNALAWQVDFFAVPEPSSGLLVLLGSMLLALRRRQAKV